MIRNLQLLRGLAALGVVFLHTGFQIVPGNATEFFGVPIFFAISGFIITHVTRSDLDNFILKRIIRVVPLYWIATVICFLFVNFGVFNVLYVFPTWWGLAHQGMIYLWGWFSTQAAATMTVAAVRHLATSMLFIPTDQLPVLGVGWTLDFEMLFYALFAVSLLVSARWAPLIAVGAVFATHVASTATSCGPICDAYGSFAPIYFVIGVAAYYLWVALGRRAAQLPKTVLGFVCITAVTFCAIAIFWHEPSDAVVTTVVAFTIMSALLAESAGFVCRNHLLLSLGDMSYSLYLIHPFVIEPMRIVGTKVAWLDQRTSIPVMLFSIVASLGLGWAVYRGVERPLLAKLRFLLVAKSSRDAALAGAKICG